MARIRDIMPRDRGSKFWPQIVRVRDGQVGQPPGSATVLAITRRVLGLIGAVSVAFETDLVLVRRGPQGGAPVIAARSNQRALKHGWILRPAGSCRCVWIVAICAFRVPIRAERKSVLNRIM